MTVRRGLAAALLLLAAVITAAATLGPLVLGVLSQRASRVAGRWGVAPQRDDCGPAADLLPAGPARRSRYSPSDSSRPDHRPVHLREDS